MPAISPSSGRSLPMEIVAYAIAIAHLLDVGGAVAGSLPPNATSVFQEGLRLSGVRLTRDDRIVDDLIRIVTENVRLPNLVLGDINAELAAVRIAERRILETVAKYGATALNATFAWLIATSEARARAVIEALPDGDYSTSDVIDGDGETEDSIPICVTVRIRGSEIEVDFTGSSPARNAPINCSRGALISAVKTIMKALVAPHEPSNEGWFRPLKVTAPDGYDLYRRKAVADGLVLRRRRAGFRSRLEGAGAVGAGALFCRQLFELVRDVFLGCRARTGSLFISSRKTAVGARPTSATAPAA